MKLYNDNKWLDIIHDKKYQDARDKILSSFKGLFFDEEPHKYYLGERELMCVSNVAHLFQEHFDSEKVAQETFERNFENPNSKYYQMTKTEILESWKKISEQACSHGTERHLFAECICYFMMGDYDKIVPEFAGRFGKDDDGRDYFEAIEPKEIAAAKFYQDMPKSFVPLMPETQVYIIKDEYAYSGTFDLLCYYDPSIDGKNSENEGLVVLDWKTNKDLYKHYGDKRFLEPFGELLDMPLSAYKLQLSAYSLCLKNIGFKVIARRIMWLLPDGTYEKISLEDYSDKLDKALTKLKPTL